MDEHGRRRLRGSAARERATLLGRVDSGNPKQSFYGTLHAEVNPRWNSSFRRSLGAVVGLWPGMPDLAGFAASGGSALRFPNPRHNPLMVRDIRWFGRPGAMGPRQVRRRRASGGGNRRRVGISPRRGGINAPEWTPTIDPSFRDCRVSYNTSESPTSCGDPSSGGLSMKIVAPFRRDRVVQSSTTHQAGRGSLPSSTCHDPCPEWVRSMHSSTRGV